MAHAPQIETTNLILYGPPGTGKTYFANCAWDMLGIPAALHCDAVIDAVCTESNETLKIQIRDGNLLFTNYDLRIHFPLPFARWYDDLVFT